MNEYQDHFNEETIYNDKQGVSRPLLAPAPLVISGFILIVSCLVIGAWIVLGGQ